MRSPTRGSAGECAMHILLLLLLAAGCALSVDSPPRPPSGSNVHKNGDGDGQMPFASYTIHRVTGLVENIAFKRHTRHVDFTAAVIKLKFKGHVHLEDFFGKKESLPMETPISKINVVNETSNSIDREKKLGVSGTVSLECDLSTGERLAIPSYSDLFDDFKGKEATPPWHLIGLPHRTKAVFGLTSSLLNILELQNPTIMKEIKEIGDVNTTDTLYFALLLKYRDDHGTDMTSKIVLDGDKFGIKTAPQSTLLERCSVHLLAPSDQKLWPTKTFLDATTDDIVYGRTNYLKYHRKERSSDAGPAHHTRKKTMKVISVLSKGIVPKDFAKSTGNLLNKYPRIKNSWHPLVPMMPHYCGLKNGSLLESEALALRAKHEMAFIQTKNRKAQPVADLGELILQFLHAFIPGLINNFLRQDTEKAAEDLNNQVPGDVLGNVPEDEIELLAQPLVHGVVTLLQDALHHTMTESISTGLGMVIGPIMAKEITHTISPRMAKMIVPTLQQSIPEKVNKVVPYLMERALPIKLNKLLTLTVTHALVPTLTTALTRTPDQEVWCYLCYYKHIHCNYCHESPQSEYYNTYYSTYYSDYYSNYYEKYYTDSLESIENLQHPPSFQGSAQKANIGLAPAGGEETKAVGYDAPDVAVTASGTKLSEIENGHDEFSGNVNLQG